MNLPPVYIRHRELQPAGTGKISHSVSDCSFPLSPLLVSCPCLEFSFNQFFWSYHHLSLLPCYFLPCPLTDPLNPGLAQPCLSFQCLSIFPPTFTSTKPLCVICFFWHFTFYPLPWGEFHYQCIICLQMLWRGFPNSGRSIGPHTAPQARRLATSLCICLRGPQAPPQGREESLGHVCWWFQRPLRLGVLSFFTQR